MRITIPNTTIEGVTATSIFISVIMYRAGDTSRKLYYGFYDSSGVLIPGGEGNLTMPGGFGSQVDVLIDSALEDQEGASDDIILRLVQIFHTKYAFQFSQSSVIYQTEVDQTIIEDYLFEEIADYVFAQLSLTAMEPLVLLQHDNAIAIGATTDETTAMKELAQDILDADLLDDIIILNLFTGSSEVQKRKGFFNPDISLIPTGSPQSHADGVSINNDNGIERYETHFEPGDGLVRTHPYMGIGFYHKVITRSGISKAGGGVALITNDGGLCYPYLSGNVSNDYTFSVDGTQKGHWYFQRRDLSQVKVWLNNSLFHTSTQPEAGYGDNALRLLIREGNSGRGVFSCFYCVTDIDDTKKTALHNGIVTAMTTLNRQM